MKTRDRIIVALDVPTATGAKEIVRELNGRVAAFKIGLQLFTAEGPSLVREFGEMGVKVFLDLKFHDIPNTVAQASVEVVRLGVWMFNLHVLGGAEMMRKTVERVVRVCEDESIDRPLIIGVTLLTSSNAETMLEVGLIGTPENRVGKLSRLAADCGLDGVVSSPQEIVAIRTAVDKSGFLTITPGIRSVNATPDDQRRVTPIRDAIANGSDYIVIGRPIIGAPDRLEAVERLIGEVEANI